MMNVYILQLTLLQIISTNLKKLSYEVINQQKIFFFKTNVQLCVVETIDKISLEFI